MRNLLAGLMSASLLVVLILAVGGQDDIWQSNLSETEQHPCLAFTEADLPLIRERIERWPYKEWFEAAKADKSPVTQAFVYSVTGDEEAAESVRQRLLRANPDGYHCSCGTGSALQGYGEAYDMVFHYPGLSEYDHRIIRAKLANACERTYLSGLISGPGQNAGNQRVRALSGLGTAAMVLRGYKASAHTPQEWLQRALDGIHQEDNLRFWRDDGMFIEGPGYSSFTMSLMMTFARYYHSICGKWLFDEPRLRNALYYLVYITQPDGRCAAIGTANSANVVRAVWPAIGAGALNDQQFFRWAIEEWSSISAGDWRSICFFDDSVKPSNRAFKPTRFYPVAQEAHLRSAWSSKAVAMWLKGKDPWLAGSYGVYSHGDVGSFVIHAYGELLAVDAGYDHWVSRELYVPELHNCLLVNGKGPVNETPGLLKNTLSAPFVEASDITSSYQDIEHTRTFLFPDKKYFIITDDIVSANDNTYQWQLHSPVTRGKAEISIQGRKASWTGYDPTTDVAGEVALETTFAGPVTLRPMQKSRWQPFSSNPKTGSYDNWAIVAERRAQSCRYLAVLYPHLTSIPAPRIQTPEIAGGLCATITSYQYRDIVLVPEEQQASFEKLSTTCRTCIVREVTGRIAWAYARGPGKVEYDGKLVMQLEQGKQCAVALKYDNDGPSRLYFWTDEEEAPAISLPAPSNQAKALHRDAHGEWQDIATHTRQGLLSVTLPADQETASLVLLAPVDRIVLDDESPPELTTVEIDGERRLVAETIDLETVRTAPARVTVEFTEKESTLDLSSLSVTVNGLPMEKDVTAKTSEDGKRLSVNIDLGTFEKRDDHSVRVAVADTSPQLHSSAFTLRFSTAPLLANGGFEYGGRQPRQWNLGAWSTDEKTKYEMRAVEDNPRSGKCCLMIKGIAGGLNLGAYQDVKLKENQAYRFAGFYRGDVKSKCSMLSDGGKTEYLGSPDMPPSEEWQPFSWEFKVSKRAQSFMVVVRHASVGTVYFDDLSLEPL